MRRRTCKILQGPEWTAVDWREVWIGDEACDGGYGQEDVASSTALDVRIDGEIEEAGGNEEREQGIGILDQQLVECCGECGEGEEPTMLGSRQIVGGVLHDEVSKAVTLNHGIVQRKDMSRLIQLAAARSHREAI